MKPHRLLIIISLLTVLGCSPQIIKMEPSTREALKQIPQITAVRHNPPELRVPRGESLVANLGLVGAVFAAQQLQDQPEHMVKDYGLQDPAIRVERSFLSSISRLLGTSNLVSLQEPIKENDLSELKAKFQQDTILDFMTTQWGILTSQYQGYHYVAYRARVRLIRFPEGKILWLGACEVEDRDPARMPHFTEFLENNGDALKLTLNKLADSCANELMAQFSDSGTSQ